MENQIKYQFKVNSNYQKRTFTILINDTKWRTNQMTKDEFEENLYNTQNDWKNYLLTSNNYYKVK